jgi:hypothetical protein
MPKDPTRNQPNYKIGGHHLNEFEFEQQHGAMTEAEHERFQRRQAEAAAGEQAAPQTEAERIQQLMADVHEQVEQRKERAQGGAAKSARKGRTAKKGATKKAGAQATKRTSAKAAKRAGAKAAKSSGAQQARGAGRKATAVAKKAGRAAKKSGARGAAKSGSTRKGAAKSVRGAGKKGARKSAR